MKFPINKILPIILPLIHFASGTSTTDLSTTLSSIRLVGSFSLGVEGLSSPITFSHNLNLPLAPVAQRVLKWADSSGSVSTQAQITQSPDVSESGAENGVLVVRGSDNEGVSSNPNTSTLTTVESEKHERVKEMPAAEFDGTDDPGPMERDVEIYVKPKSVMVDDLEHDCAMDVPDYDSTDEPGPMEGAVEVYRLWKEDEEVDLSTVEYGLGLGQKRKPNTQGVENVTRAVVKRAKVEADTDEVRVHGEASKMRLKKHKKALEEGRKQSRRRRKCCRHCEREE